MVVSYEKLFDFVEKLHTRRFFSHPFFTLSMFLARSYFHLLFSQERQHQHSNQVIQSIREQRKRVSYHPGCFFFSSTSSHVYKRITEIRLLLHSIQNYITDCSQQMEKKRQTELFYRKTTPISPPSALI